MWQTPQPDAWGAVGVVVKTAGELAAESSSLVAKTTKQAIKDEWTRCVTRFIKAELKRKDITYADLAHKLTSEQSGVARAYSSGAAINRRGKALRRAAERRRL
jgi:hypothetical protein